MNLKKGKLKAADTRICCFKMTKIRRLFGRGPAKQVSYFSKIAPKAQKNIGRNCQYLLKAVQKQYNCPFLSKSSTKAVRFRKIRKKQYGCKKQYGVATLTYTYICYDIRLIWFESLLKLTYDTMDEKELCQKPKV